MIKVKGFTRQGGAVVNADISGYEAIKRDRTRKKTDDSIRKEVNQLRELVFSLKKDIEELKRG